MKQEITLIIDENTQFTLRELSDACHIHTEWIVQLVDYGILTPKGKKPEVWRFSGVDIKRSQKALRLQQDLQIELNGLALVLDLLDELDDLRQQLQHWEKLHGEL